MPRYSRYSPEFEEVDDYHQSRHSGYERRAPYHRSSRYVEEAPRRYPRTTYRSYESRRPEPYYRPYRPRDEKEFERRQNPEPNRCIGIFNLSKETEEKDLTSLFSKYGSLEKIDIVYDAQTKLSRGFAFCYYKEIEDAKTAVEQCNGIDLDGRSIRVDFSITEKPHEPTPGTYMGKRRLAPRGGRGRGRGGYRREGPYYRERSPSPYYGRQYSRSPSFSPPPRRRDYY